jgi:hypothetical protein
LLELAGESIGANTAARQQERRLEVLLMEALLLGRMWGDLPAPTALDLRSPQPLMAGRAMTTARARPERCDREPCHGKVVQDRTER